MTEFDTKREAARRRPWDLLERRIVKLHMRRPDEVPEKLRDALRYVISFARLTVVRNVDGEDVDVSGALGAHSAAMYDVLAPQVELASDLWELVRILPDLVQRTRVARIDLLEHLPIDRDSLEREITTRNLVVVSGGGGGSGYGYLGAHRPMAPARSWGRICFA